MNLLFFRFWRTVKAEAFFSGKKLFFSEREALSSVGDFSYENAPQQIPRDVLRHIISP
jgi:hypothetical protein